MIKCFNAIVLGAFSLFFANAYCEYCDEPVPTWFDICVQGNGNLKDDEPFPVDYYFDGKKSDCYNPASDPLQFVDWQARYDEEHQYDNPFADDTFCVNIDVPDCDLTKEIQERYSVKWCNQGIRNCYFSVNGGNVLIEGSVDTSDDRRTVENDIRSVEGVKKVHNIVSVNGPQFDYPKNSNPIGSKQLLNQGEPQTASFEYNEQQLASNELMFPQDAASTSEDRQLNARIRGKLTGIGLYKGNDTIALHTNDGFVKVTGIVQRPEDIAKIRQAVSTTIGVKNLRTQIDVKKICLGKN